MENKNNIELIEKARELKGKRRGMGVVDVLALICIGCCVAIFSGFNPLEHRAPLSVPEAAPVPAVVIGMPTSPLKRLDATVSPKAGWTEEAIDSMAEDQPRRRVPRAEPTAVPKKHYSGPRNVPVKRHSWSRWQ